MRLARGNRALTARATVAAVVGPKRRRTGNQYRSENTGPNIRPRSVLGDTVNGVSQYRSEVTINRGWRTAVEVHLAPALQAFADVSNRGYRDATVKHLQSRLKEMVDGSSVRVRVRRSALPGIIAAGRLMTVYETGVPHSFADLDARKELEQQFFGYGIDMPAVDRPIYGYLRQTEPRYGGLSRFGRVVLHLKPHVRARTAFTVGDSLDNVLSGGVVTPKLAPSTLTEPHWTSAWFGGERDDPNPAAVGPDFMFLPFYVEATIHGGITIDDIEGITCLDSADLRDVTTLLEQTGTPWTVT